MFSNSINKFDSFLLKQYNGIDNKTKKSQGVVFTPSYIAKYIIKNCIDVSDGLYNKKPIFILLKQEIYKYSQ